MCSGVRPLTSRQSITGTQTVVLSAMAALLSRLVRPLEMPTLWRFELRVWKRREEGLSRIGADRFGPLPLPLPLPLPPPPP